MCTPEGVLRPWDWPENAIALAEDLVHDSAKKLPRHSVWLRHSSCVSAAIDELKPHGANCVALLRLTSADYPAAFLHSSLNASML
jgi:hypothetical protein